MPTLYLVGTPIGNLEDISFRALRILKEVGLIAAEDTRISGRLLKRYNITTPMISFHEHSNRERISEIVNKLSLIDVALISDAGMPTLSDPGFRLVKAAIEAGINIVPIPGPSAPVAALVTSGLPTDAFLFLGFLPRKSLARRNALARLTDVPFTLVIFESPHRIRALLADIKDVLGDRKLSISRELTKIHEETWRGKVSEALEYFEQSRVRGEFTLVVSGAPEVVSRWDREAVQSALTKLMETGISRKDAVADVAERSGWRKRDVYNLAVSKN